MNETTFIYGLCDPRTGFLRYVGKANRPKVRLYRHHCTDKKKSHRTSWLISLKQAGLKPDMFILEEVPSGEWEEAERFWISYLRSIGCPLVNTTGGGDGVSQVTDETRAKLKAIALARPKPGPETRLKMSLAHRGHQRNKGRKWKTPHPFKGKRLSEDHRQKIVNALLRRSPETLKKIGVATKRIWAERKARSQSGQLALGLSV